MREREREDAGVVARQGGIGGSGAAGGVSGGACGGTSWHFFPRMGDPGRRETREERHCPPLFPRAQEQKAGAGLGEERKCRGERESSATGPLATSARERRPEVRVRAAEGGASGGSAGGIVHFLPEDRLFVRTASLDDEGEKHIVGGWNRPTRGWMAEPSPVHVSSFLHVGSFLFDGGERKREMDGGVERRMRIPRGGMSREVFSQRERRGAEGVGYVHGMHRERWMGKKETDRC